jgi:hypothetical protein
MPSSTSNLSIDEQQAAVATAAAVATKRKEDDAAAAAQAAAATAHREQEALVAAVAAACKTLDEARAREHAAPSLGKRRRPSPVTWNSSSPLPKGS